MKAFLSHSSSDKEIVRAVAQELGRQFCLFDEQAFATGTEFKDSIEWGLDESSLFVLFASRNALDSIWVQFEIEEAWYQRLQKTLTQSLVYIIDSSVDYVDLPVWLTRALVSREISAKAIARDIRYHLDELLRDRQSPYFVGRTQDVGELESDLIPYDGSIPPHSLFVTGLPGIGRRTLIKHKVPELLSLKKSIEIRIEEGDSINDICIRLASEVEPYSTIQGLENIVQKLRALADAEALQRILENLRTLVRGGQIPIFVDQGGLLDSEGLVRSPIQSILRSLAPNDEAYILLVSTRRPQQLGERAVPVVHLEPLKDQDTRRLLKLLAESKGVPLSHLDLAILSEYVAGYPPAAYFAIRQAKDYGLEIVKREKDRLSNFLTSVFLKHIKESALSQEEVGVIQLLASYSPLPLPVIAKVLRPKFAYLDAKHLDDIVIRLIDLALVIATASGYYRVADPIVDAALKEFGYLEDEQVRRLAIELSAFLQDSKADLPRLELSSVLFRAARLVGDNEISDQAIHLASDLIYLTEELYHKRRYPESITVGYAALAERPDSVNARSYLIRSLIQQESWVEGEENISELQKYAPLRDVFFLKGFLRRKQGRIPEAVDAYKESERLGRRGAAILRELASCYFWAGDLDKASDYVQRALGRHPDNRYVVDLAIQISSRRGDERTARQDLARLEIIGIPIYYYHRLSRVEADFGHWHEARDAALKAYKSEQFPPFEVIAQLAYCEIELRHFDEATNLLEFLDKNFPKVRNDIRTTLRCRVELARGHYADALKQSERIIDKKSFFYKNIRRDSLAGELRTSALADRVRIAYEKELALLEKDLTGVTSDLIMPVELDPFHVHPNAFSD